MGRITVYHNAKAYIQDPDRHFAECFAVRDGMFEYVGNEAGARTRYGNDTDCIHVDINGRCVLPGFVEAHSHLVGKNTVNEDDIILIPPNAQPEELGDILLSGIKQDHAENNKVIKAMGINLKLSDKWRASLIDEVYSQSPVFVFSDDGHALLMNRAAMALAGIDENTEDPSDASYFVRDENGHPTGLAIEIPALLMCKDAISSDTDKEELKDRIINEIRKYSALGYTTAYDAATVLGDNCEILDILKELDDENLLDMELFLSFEYEQDDEYLADAGEYISFISILRDKYDGRLIHPSSVKFILDGTIENRTACLFESYCHDPDSDSDHNVDLDHNGDLEGKAENRKVYGELQIPPDEYSYMAQAAAEAGFSLHVHAIGDRGVREALNGLRSLNDVQGTRTIAHNQLLDDVSLDLYKSDPEIFYNTTPCWVEEDEYTLKVLGEERYSKQFPTGSVCRNGVRVTFGSDSLDGDKSLNPFLGIYYSMNRGGSLMPKGSDATGITDHETEKPSAGIIGPESESLDVYQAIDAYTINGAMQLMADRYTGSIKEGKYADFIILSDDIFSCDAENIPEIWVDSTYFRGKCVYQRA